MNDAPASSANATRPAPYSGAHDHDHASVAERSTASASPRPQSPLPEDAAPSLSRARPPRTRHQLRAEKQNELLADVLKGLNALVWVQVCVGYYMDTSFPLLLLRTFPHLLLLEPHPAGLPPLPAPIHRPYVTALGGPFLICAFVHAFMAPATGSELSRGYVHGGLMVDLVGMPGGERNRWLCLVCDVVILALQLIMLGVTMEKEVVKRRADGKEGTIGEPDPRDSGGASTRHAAGFDSEHGALVGRDERDLDAEERGTRRADVVISSTSDIEDYGIEMDELQLRTGTRSESPDAIVEQERSHLLTTFDNDAIHTDVYPPNDTQLHRHDNIATPENHSSNPIDMDAQRTQALEIFASGEAIIAELHLLDTIRAQWRQCGFQGPGPGPSRATPATSAAMAASAIRTVGFSAGFVSARAQAVVTARGV